ncbi:CHAT domain-containing protein [Runella salmonicolor]|uniref:CHAT domain-containing tetratricopeptide repeat protein n=1 Tax=Runella salmonicolor TaxID=2950278 RepID=A0ABT1G0L8_9BACT|nr:CHAT domain-containing tetratricopeptide repeat protein [Runella salmonicolor]MCP1386508.1 CHAT domain-containing tetratricopeptide repeat protein [Runella salmonicolor]
MQKRSFLGVVFLLILSVLIFAQDTQYDAAARLLYKEALRLFNLPNATDQTDSLATIYFEQAAHLWRNSPQYHERIDSHEKAGTLYQTVGKQNAALQQYQMALSTGKQYQVSDSLLYKSYLYSGSAHYYLGTLDSATYYLEEAERIFNRFPQLDEANRLFNTFGVLYYEAGNYRQSINYFQRALQVERVDNDMTYAYKSNIASALRNLGEYDSAIVVYQSIRKLKANPYEVNINLGATFIEKNIPEAALQYLWKAGEQRGYYGIVQQNAFGKANLLQKRWLEADYHFREALKISERDFGKDSRNINLANTYKLMGDLALQRSQLDMTLAHYQQSMKLLVNGFDPKTLWQNPSNFSKSYNSYQLFETLCGKANALRLLYEKNPTAQYQNAAIDAYNTVFQLASYVQKTFDNEEARLYVVKKGYPFYEQAVQLMMKIYGRTKQPAHLQKAFAWAEQSKATVLQISLKENQIKTQSDIPDSLLRQERNLQYRRSGLLLRLRNASDSTQLASFSKQLLDNELELSRLIDHLHDFPTYYQQKFRSDSIDLTTIQQRILDKKTALLSYFQTADTVLCFAITQQQITHFSVPRTALFDKSVQNLLQNLQQVEAGRPYNGRVYAQYLYNCLVQPAEQQWVKIESVVVLPHANLSLLPFEALEDQKSRYLLEKYTFSYQYAAAFLKTSPPTKIEFSEMLSVAPFNEKTAKTYASLTASLDEIKPLKGVKLIGKQATKQYFLKYASESSAIHLATHAVVNNTNPLESFVVFSPTNADHRLYAHELSSINLGKAQLIFLSACETASGKIEQGEGVLSLARAFAAAGCHHLITSLWKAEDHATAFVTQQFYTYLHEGYDFAEALRKAKLDLLKDSRYAQFHSPQYWSHLIYISTPPRQTQWPVWLYIVPIILIISLIGGWMAKKKRNPQPTPHPR